MALSASEDLEALSNAAATQVRTAPHWWEHSVLSEGGQRQTSART